MSAAATAALVLVVAVESVADADPLVTELDEITRGRLDRGGDRDLALDVALATNEELVVGAVGTWPADRPRGQAAQLGVAQPAVTQQPQKRV